LVKFVKIRGELYFYMYQLASKIPLVLNKRPVYYLIHVTGKCNARCSHCFYWKEIQEAKHEINTSYEEFEKIAANLGNVLLINLCGAEAFLRTDLCELVHLFAQKNKCHAFTIPSNGSLTKRIVEYADRMCEENPKSFFRFGFSIDGPKEAHDKIRGVPGLFEKVCETVRQVAELKKKHKNFVVMTSTIFSSETQHHILDFMDWIKDNLPVQQTNTTFIRGNPMVPETLNVDPVIYKKLLQKIRSKAILTNNDLGPSALITYSMFLNTLNTVEKANANPGKRVFNCFGGEKFLVISKNTAVHPCELLDESKEMGQLKDFDYDINKLLLSDKARSVRDWVKEEHCACTWECAIQSSKLFDPLQWPALAKRASTVAASSLASL